MNTIIIILTLLLIVAGLPLFVALGLISIISFLAAGTDPTVIILEMNRIASAPTLLAIPLFTLAGYILAESKAPRRLYDLLHTTMGRLSGGIALASLVTCALFTCITGASGITIIAIGGLIYPILLKQNYSEQFSLGLVTCSGSLGLLFPPSLPLILYGIVASVSIDKLFLAGIVPGILIIVVLYIYSIIKGQKKSENHFEQFSMRTLGKYLYASKWELPIPIIIIGGIYGGFLTVVEAAAVTAFYTFVIEFFVNKDLSIKKDFVRIFRDTTKLVGGILIILGMAMGFTNYLIDEQIPQELLSIVQNLISSRITFLLLLNAFLLITGFFLDIFSAIIIVVPMIVPIATSYGIDPVHLGIIFLTNLEIGYLTPPVGLNLFISSYRFKKSILHLYKVSFPFLLLLLLCLAIITYFPDLSLFIVNLFY
ncbi:MAG: TRAP transporter large permease subunit [Candidatus Marinimicrobia bacterium]|nr:TRAP transporter large permease subunit [Candidatus Neomarinimicrobiota bacterium]